MLKLERQLFIEKELHEKGRVLVSEHSKVLDCSEETIRRDIKEMEAAGKLNKIHGGAYLPDKYDKGGYSYLDDFESTQSEIGRAHV